MAETYSDWNTYARGTATRIERLNLRISFLQSQISIGNYSVKDKTHDFTALQRELDSLRKLEKEESAILEASSSTPTRVSFTRGRVINP